MTAATHPGAAPDEEADASRAPLLRPLPMDLKAAVREFEIAQISHALDQTRSNQRAAARLLGLSYHQLRGAMRKYRLSEKYGRTATRPGRKKKKNRPASDTA